MKLPSGENAGSSSAPGNDVTVRNRAAGTGLRVTAMPIESAAAATVAAAAIIGQRRQCRLCCPARGDPASVQSVSPFCDKSAAAAIAARCSKTGV